MKSNQIESINWEKEFPEIPVCVQDAISNATNEILSKRQKKVRHMPRKRMLLLAAVITLLSSMTVLAATGLWKQRMEAMNREEIEEYFLSIAASNAPAFRYSRVMSEEERTHFNELTLMYEKEGVFPEGALTMLSSAEEYQGKGVGYDKKSGTFFLPEKALSEEQLLQIIDFCHKAEYSLSGMSQLADSEEIAQMVKDERNAKEGADREAAAMLNFEPLNEAVSYYEVPLQGEELLINVAAGRDYLFFGFKTEIKRMPVGGDTAEVVYELQENETLFALDSDSANNMYLSLRVYHPEEDSYTNRILKIDAKGETVLEYDLENVVYGETSLKEKMACKMLADEKGQLYVKYRWSSNVVVFVFDSEGNYVENISSEQHRTHDANGMCFGEDGFLYVLAEKSIVKLDTEAKEVTAAYDYWTDEMIAAVDVIYPMGEDSFYLLSYDGLFKYNIGEQGSERLLAPYESGVFAEGYRYTPISEEKLVVINLVDYEKFEYKITYLELNEE